MWLKKWHWHRFFALYRRSSTKNHLTNKLSNAKRPVHMTVSKFNFCTSNRRRWLFSVITHHFCLYVAVLSLHHSSQCCLCISLTLSTSTKSQEHKSSFIHSFIHSFSILEIHQSGYRICHYITTELQGAEGCSKKRHEQGKLKCICLKIVPTISNI